MISRNKALLLSAGTAGVAVIVAAAVYLLFPRERPGILDGSGQVRGIEVTVSSRLSGVAREVPIREGQLLKKGGLIARIASEETQARLAQAEAQAAAAENQLRAAEAQLKQLEIAIDQARMAAQVTEGATGHDVHRAREAVERAKAEVEATEAQFRQDQRSYERYQKLVADGFISQSYFDEVRARYTASAARMRAAKQGAAEAQASLERARATSGEVGIRRKEVDRLQAERERMRAARAALENEVHTARARVDEVSAALADTTLLAPSEGTVMAKLVERGELVAPGRPLATLVNLQDLYVRVFIPERDIGKIRLGNPARIVTDAFPVRDFSGEVSEIAQQAEFTPKEVHMKDERVKLVFGVKVRIDNPEGYLKPGMPVDVKIKWQDDVPW
ncbi:MAG: efflux RND transporter periplasmic adaptor subunit [Betaproteobacteria bacterium]|nr:efflux RND transporter periplasmic adaptor subunit [Betaproteobacteria bacterium]